MVFQLGSTIQGNALLGSQAVVKRLAAMSFWLNVSGCFLFLVDQSAGEIGKGHTHDSATEGPKQNPQGNRSAVESTDANGDVTRLLAHQGLGKMSACIVRVSLVCECTVCTPRR